MKRFLFFLLPVLLLLTACQPPNSRKSPPHTRAEGSQVQTVLCR